MSPYLPGDFPSGIPTQIPNDIYVAPSTTGDLPELPSDPSSDSAPPGSGTTPNPPSRPPSFPAPPTYPLLTGKLSTTRLSNDSEGIDVVIGHEQLEDALEQMFSIEDGKNIATAIFGNVRSDGGIWMLRFKNDSITSSPTQSAGIRFYDYVKHKYLAFVNSKIGIWGFNSDTQEWELKFDYELDEEPYLINFSDVSISDAQLVDGKIIGTSNELKFIMRDAVVRAAGVQDFKDLGDVHQSNFNDLWSEGFPLLKVGHFIGIDSDAKVLITVAPDATSGDHNDVYSIPAELPRMGILGVGDWEQMRGFQNLIPNLLSGAMSSASVATSITSLNGIPNSGINIKAGIYKVSVLPHVLNGTHEEFMQWQIISSGNIVMFPNNGKVIAPMPLVKIRGYEVSPDLTLDYWTLHMESYPGNEFHGEVFVVALSDTVIGVQMSAASEQVNTVGILFTVTRVI